MAFSDAPAIWVMIVKVSIEPSSLETKRSHIPARQIGRSGSGLHFAQYNFVRLHQTLKVTPAIAAGVTSNLWEVSDMVKFLDDWEAAP